jgi:hypothetical protein
MNICCKLLNTTELCDLKVSKGIADVNKCLNISQILNMI